MKFPNVPSTSVKLMLFPFSLEGAARIWLEKEPPRSIQTWDDLVSKFINKFFPPKSKVRYSRNKPGLLPKCVRSTSTPEVISDVAELKDMVKALLLDKKNKSPAPTPVKAVEESCVTSVGCYSYPRTCQATNWQWFIEILFKNMSSQLQPQLSTTRKTPVIEPR
ncbi:reverse transcriptase domain-containing protein [Tanacetum coccineum]